MGVPKAVSGLKPGADPAVAVEWLEGLLAAVGAVSAGRPGRRTWQCPAHDGNSPALRIRVGNVGAMLFCHAGCSTDRVLARLALRREHLFRPPPGTPERYRLARLSRLRLPYMDPNAGGHPVSRGLRLEAEHAYGSPAQWWLLRYRHPTTGAKDVAWESRNPRGERVPGLLGTPAHALPLYREHDLTPALGAGEPVLVVESESSVDALRGHYATTWAGGAGSPNLDALRRVLGEHPLVVYLGDADGPGRACAALVAEALPLARIHVPDGDAGTDARDELARLGHAGFARLVSEVLA